LILRAGIDEAVGWQRSEHIERKAIPGDLLFDPLGAPGDRRELAAIDQESGVGDWRLTRLNPSVASATPSRSTPGPSGSLADWMVRISARVVRSGNSISNTRSKRPGLSRAGSI
jgi:hypothetical protein